MTKLLLFFFSILSIHAYAQRNGVWDGRPNDSTEFSFEITDTLFKNGYRVDTSNAKLWQIGNTTKTFSFNSGFSERSIMTDTTDPYPVDANDWFQVTGKIKSINPIVSFRHKYETRNGADGGIVEFSLDSGLTWNNVIGNCEAANQGRGLLVTNFYGSADTLFNGDKGFSGSSNGWIFSRFQFFSGIPIRTNQTTQNCIPVNLFVRFRFISDTVADTLGGWLIDSIKIENDNYGGSVNEIAYNQLHVYPNPSSTGVINYPSLNNEQEYTIEVFDAIGRRILTTPYKHQLDLRNYKGMHYYKVKSPSVIYSGTILLE